MRLKVEEGFSKANGSNLPVVSCLMVYDFIASSTSTLSAEIRGAKMLRAAQGDRYGNDAVGYVQVKVAGSLYTVLARMTPEHKINKNAYQVKLVVSNKANDYRIVYCQCQSCAASKGTCKHAVAFLFWMSHQTEKESPTSVECYWKKSKLASVRDMGSKITTTQHTLTGHSGKVLAAKFLGQSARVVTGSHDRTLKIWDLRSRACIETKFAGSSCNDVVTSETFTFISGHFDKRIRFWDARCDGTSSSNSGSAANDIVLQGRITSLDLSKDGYSLLCCVRDDTLRMFDLRAKQEVCTFSSENFKVGCDWSRAVFSPNGQLVGAGGQDGAVFVWSTINGQLVCEGDSTEHGCAVTAVSWHPFGSFLASVDRGKKAIVWSGD